MSEPKLHAGHMLYALAQHFNWFQNRMLPEYEVGGLADLAFITKSGYLTEIEIKISRADWRADKDKRKWQRDRPHVSRFFYAVPESLADWRPEWMAPGAGLLVVRPVSHRSGRILRVREVVAAKRRKALPLSAGQQQRLMDACYYRYWRLRLSLDGMRFASDFPEKKLEAA